LKSLSLIKDLRRSRKEGRWEGARGSNLKIPVKDGGLEKKYTLRMPIGDSCVNCTSGWKGTKIISKPANGGLSRGGGVQRPTNKKRPLNSPKKKRNGVEITIPDV